MSLVDDASSNRRGFAWDVGVTVAAGLLLTLVGWTDFTAHRSHRDRAWSDFPFLSVRGEKWTNQDEVFRNQPAFVQCRNLGSLERNRKRSFRHALGPESVIEIWAPWRAATLRFRLYNPIEGQELTVSYNGAVLERFHGLARGNLAREYPLELRAGANRFTLACERYNGAGAEVAAGDRRPIFGTFSKLDLDFDRAAR